MRAERRIVLIVAARALSEAAILAVVGSFVHAGTLGREPIALGGSVLALFGVTLVLSAVLRERGTVKQSAGLALVVIGGAIAWGLSQPAVAPDGLAVLSRIVGFGLAGEAYLWRVLGIARGLQRWREVRDGALLALFVVVVASLAPGPIDREALAPLALAVAVSGAVALSVARAVEELSLVPAHVRGRAATGAASGTAFAIGTLAVGVALVLPAAQEALARLGRAVGPILGDAVFVLLLPLGYLAAYVVYFFLWLRDTFGLGGAFEVRPPPPPGAGDDDLARLREAEELRPYVFGALEILIALVGLAVAVALVAKLVQERRSRLPEGATLDRERVDGIGLRATLGSLLPRRAARQQAPADDGTRATAVRRLYWRLLDVAERSGPGRRDDPETPFEHETRLVASGERWRAATPLVRAFEEVRYGEREPNEATVAAAREALRRVEATG